MNAIDWSAIAAVAELLGVLGLIASLIFVGLQMKQTAMAIRSNANHGIQEAFRDSVQRVAHDENLAAIFHRELPKAGSLSGVEEFRFALANQALMQMYSNAHYQHAIGVLDENTWGSLDAQLGNYLKTPGMRAYWERRGKNFPKDFENHVNNDVMKTPQQESYRTAGT